MLTISRKKIDKLKEINEMLNETLMKLEVEIFIKNIDIDNVNIIRLEKQRQEFIQINK